MLQSITFDSREECIFLRDKAYDMDWIIIGKCQKGNGMLKLKGIGSVSMNVMKKLMEYGHVSGMGDEI